MRGSYIALLDFISAFQYMIHFIYHFVHCNSCCERHKRVRRLIHKSLLYCKIVHNLTPSYLVDLLPTRVCERTQLSLRSALNFTIFPARTERFKLSFSPSTTKERNNINAQLRSRDSIGTFKRELSIHTSMGLLLFGSVNLITTITTTTTVF